LAVLGAFSGRRRLIAWLGGIGGLFLLIGLGAGTPFYRIWWAVMPFMKQVRAPGMALYIVALVLAIYAALGVERVERKEGMAWVALSARWRKRGVPNLRRQAPLVDPFSRVRCSAR
jgi:hypothetical protein